MTEQSVLFQRVALPCGVVLKNRIAKSAMSDSLGDGTGHPTAVQNRLYQRWAEGGIAASIIGEVQPTSLYPEKPGNLVLNARSDLARFKDLAQHGGVNGSFLWLQIGNAGALAHEPISSPKGPSALDLDGLSCEALGTEDIRSLPSEFAASAKLAQQAGFGGVQIHAAHGFLLSQFLSPLFNKRDDSYGGCIENRMRLLLEAINAVRMAVGPSFPIAVKLNSSDQLEDGFGEDDALCVVEALDKSSIDLIDISGGTYFPGAKAASDSAGKGPYFMGFAKHARAKTSKPLMLTGGFKTRAQAEEAIQSGCVDIVGLARALVLEPDLANRWMSNEAVDPVFPRFADAPEGGITAWYTMRLTAIGSDAVVDEVEDLTRAISEYDARDAERSKTWLRHFKQGVG